MCDEFGQAFERVVQGEGQQIAGSGGGSAGDVGLPGRPSALAAALTKVSGEIARIPTQDLRQAEAFNAFFFAPAIAPGFSLSSLFATHPPLEQRLSQLAGLARQLGRQVQ